MFNIALYQPDIPQNTAAIIRLCSCFNTTLEIIEPCGFNLDDKRLKRVVMDYFNKCRIITYKSYEKFLGDASSGLYLYNEQFHLGYSVINLLQSSFNKEAGDGFGKNIEERVYYGMAGYKFKIDRDWYIEPSVLLRKRDKGSSEYNFSTRIFYMDQIWTGLSFRSNQSLSISVGTNSDKIQFAYSFDHYFGEISQYQLGTHEVTMSIMIPNNVKNY